MKRAIWVLMALLLALPIWAKFTDEFQSAFAAAEEIEQQRQVISEYLPKASDVDDHRILQSYWMQVDKEACTAHYNKMFSDKPNDPTAHYLWVRMQDSEVQLKQSRVLIRNHPKFYWSYRTHCVTFTELLVDGPDDSYLNSDEYYMDKSYVRQGLQLFPEDPYLLYCLFNVYRVDKKLAEAASTLGKIKDGQILMSNWKVISEYAIQQSDADLFKAIYPKILHYAIQNEQLAAADSLKFFNDEYLKFLGTTKNWKGIQAFLKKNPKADQKPEYSYRFSRLFVEFDKPDLALSLLEKRLKAGDESYLDLKADDALIPLHNKSGWAKLMKKAEAEWKSEEKNRRAEALKDRMQADAPLWTLEDAKGNMVSLQDLKGRIVVLDFWATWCGPCKMAMPALDNWMKTAMPAGVEVFSVNVMERDPQKAKDYFAENPYKMTLLIGNNDISKAYNVKAIPHILVIDKAGKMAYSQTGYSPDLEEKLSFWTEALLQE